MPVSKELFEGLVTAVYRQPTSERTCLILFANVVFNAARLRIYLGQVRREN